VGSSFGARGFPSAGLPSDSNRLHRAAEVPNSSSRRCTPFIKHASPLTATVYGHALGPVNPYP